MAFLITKGLGEDGRFTESALTSTIGLGDPGPPVMPPGYAFQVVDAESFGSSVILSFTRDLIIGGDGADPTKYVFTPYNPPVAAEVVVTAVTSIGSGKIRLTCDEQTIGELYAIAIPDVGIVSADHYELNAPYTVDVVGVGYPVQVVMVRPFDCRILEVHFSEAVVEIDALTTSNYTISPTLDVIRVEKVTDLVYNLITSRQTELASYSVTVSNIRDLDHNVIL